MCDELKSVSWRSYMNDHFLDFYKIGDLEVKLKSLPSLIQSALTSGFQHKIDIGSLFTQTDSFHFVTPHRGKAEIIPLQLHPPKKGLSTKEGQARLLHDLMNIELQAMELGLRTLIEFPDAPLFFREELAELTLAEGRHLEMGWRGLQDLGYEWGDWPVHVVLLQSVSPQDTLLDRIFIVHRYLEGSGLDAQETILRRLQGISGVGVTNILKQIHKEEIDHVFFGNKWFHLLSKQQDTKTSQDATQASYKEATQKTMFRDTLWRLRNQLPKRIEPICHRWRLQSGFTPDEITELEYFRSSRLAVKTK